MKIGSFRANKVHCTAERIPKSSITLYGRSWYGIMLLRGNVLYFGLYFTGGGGGGGGGDGGGGVSSNLYRLYYPHRLRELVSPVCGIFE